MGSGTSQKEEQGQGGISGDNYKLGKRKNTFREKQDKIPAKDVLEYYVKGLDELRDFSKKSQ